MSIEEERSPIHIHIDQYIGPRWGPLKAATVRQRTDADLVRRYIGDQAFYQLDGNWLPFQNLHSANAPVLIDPIGTGIRLA